MDAFTSVFGALAAFLLGRAGTVLESRQQFRRKLRLAVSDLLEIRHFLCGYSITMTELSKISPLGPKDVAQLRSVILQIFPIEPGLDERYSQTITAICEADPIAGHRLRSLNLVRGLLRAFTSIELQMPPDLPPLPEIEKVIRESWIPHLEEVLLSVAARSNFLLWLRLRRRFSSPQELPPEALNLLEELRTRISRIPGGIAPGGIAHEARFAGLQP